MGNATAGWEIAGRYLEHLDVFSRDLFGWPSGRSIRTTALSSP